MRSAARRHIGPRGAGSLAMTTLLLERRRRISRRLAHGAVATICAIPAGSGCGLAAREQFSLATEVSAS
jgi:hypothetical protein